MSKLMENKQLVHIASEAIVLIGITFYFNQKHKKLMSYIEDLAQRVEGQEDIIQKHEMTIGKLIETVNNLSVKIDNNMTSKEKTRSFPDNDSRKKQKAVTRKTDNRGKVHKFSPLNPPTSPVSASSSSSLPQKNGKFVHINLDNAPQAQSQAQTREYSSGQQNAYNKFMPVDDSDEDDIIIQGHPLSNSTVFVNTYTNSATIHEEDDEDEEDEENNDEKRTNGDDATSDDIENELADELKDLL